MATSTDFVNALNQHLQSRDQMGSYSPAENASYWGRANQLLSGITDPQAREALGGQVKNYQTQSEQLTSSAQAMIKNAGDMTSDVWSNMSSGDQQKYAQGRGISTSAINDGLAFKGDVNEGVFTQMNPQAQNNFLQRYIQGYRPGLSQGNGGPSLGFYGEGGDNPFSQTWDSVRGSVQGGAGGIVDGRWIPEADRTTASDAWGGIAGAGAGGMAGATLGVPGAIAGAVGGNQWAMGKMPWDTVREAVGTAGGTAIGAMLPGMAVPGAIAGGIAGNKAGTGGMGGIGGGKGGGSTMGDDIPMPELGGYQSAFGGLNANTLAPAAVPYSAWKDMALNKQNAEESKMMSDAASQSAGGLANARAQLSMRGGLRGGAAERLARGGASDLMGARQNVMGQGVINRANIGMQGAQMDTDVNKFNANMGNDAQKFNIQNSINDISGANDWQKLKYSEGMKLKGAGMTGQAIKNAGKK